MSIALSAQFIKNMMNAIQKQNELCVIMINYLETKTVLSEQDLTEINIGLQSMKTASGAFLIVLQEMLNSIYNSQN